MSTILLHRLENITVRTVQIDGKTYFVGKDAAASLGYANESDALNTHCRGVAKRYPIPDALGRLQETRIIDEPDLMRLIVNSTLPTAERVERWVFEEVLPSIRQTGGYQIAPRTPGEMLLASAQALLAVEQKQAEIKADVARLEGQVQDLAESRVWDHCPQNCEPISKIVDRMNKRYALPDWVVHRIMRELPTSPKPHAMVRNHHEEARGSQYVVYAVADVTRLFAQFVKDCVQETPTLWSHRDIDKRFQLMPDGRKPKPLKAHAKAEMAAA
ncbi:BRO-N domain-containing protein [Comamonas koreensis]|uniref:Bro-N domain-containing protein n=1 Tax=Comamonas koreensis TaxID=160825 RepID=A0AAW4XTQ3_9BURK|nr:BRO family protein [Comamonas koreensis]MCD2164900.1 hypothetical protein [Comamonas koreensis]